MIRKPLLAVNYDESKLVFPLGLQPKIDGVRGLNLDGNLTGRSLKPFANRYTTAFFSKPEYQGFDGELAANDERHPRLCHLTTSATSTILGEPFLLWHVFDYLTEKTINLSYEERYAYLREALSQRQDQRLCGHLRIVPMYIVHNLKQLNDWDEQFLEQGYEGTILRNLAAKHKEGRSTIKGGHLLRIKRFIEEEAIVLSINEGNRNDNEAQINELGHTYRTSHQENKVANGMVGSMECRIIKSSDLFTQGQRITVSKGEMTQEEATHYFEHPEKLIGQVIKFKHFPKGVKDKPRFPTFKSLRSMEDM